MSILSVWFFYQIYHGLGDSEPTDENDKKIWHFFRNEIIPDGVSYDPTWWWTGIVWASAAVAIHNVQQFPIPWPGCNDKQCPLSLEEDPIAYLGILVDILQEWDRYYINRSSIFTGLLPQQGIDINLSSKNNILQIHYLDINRVKRIRQTLNDSLVGWRDIIQLANA